MFKKFRCYGTFLLLLPLAVGVEIPTEDSSETNIRFAGGGGSYASILRGCEGEVLQKDKLSYSDYGMSVDHGFRNSPLKIGLRGGYIKVEQYDAYYINPNFSFEGRLGGLRLGVLTANHKGILTSRDDDFVRQILTVNLRLGPTKSVHFSGSFFENLPLYSGGGLVDAGVGFGVGPRSTLWLGFSGLPFDGLGLLAKSDVGLNRNWLLNLSGRYGNSEGINEWGISAGITYRLVK